MQTEDDAKDTDTGKNPLPERVQFEVTFSRCNYITDSQSLGQRVHQAEATAQEGVVLKSTLTCWTNKRGCELQF